MFLPLQFPFYCDIIRWNSYIHMKEGRQMANIYTDEVRIARYEKLRGQKKLYDLIFGICVLILLVMTAGLAVGGLLRGIVWGLFINQMGDFFATIGLLVCCGFSLYAISRRDWHWLLPVTIAVGIFSGGLFLFPLLPSLAVSVFWSKLKEEEGFPDFKITQVEQRDREQAIIKNLEHRAVENGTRVRQETLRTDADMNDLLDENAPQVLPAELRSYHERSRDAEAAVVPAAQHDDRMDSLEDL